MKKALISAAVAAACSTPFAVLAQAAPAKAAPEYTIAGNAGLFSDYRFRGFTQTDYNPALQGGIDFAHKSGFYLGNWNSNVNSTVFNGASLEMDFYGGYKTTFGDFGLDVGTIYYYYPGTGANGPYEAKNWEVYVGGSYGPVSLKYYYAFTDFFGLKGPGVSTDGSQYFDLSGTFPVGDGFAVVAHAGFQIVKNYEELGGPSDNVWDYKLGGTWDILGSGWTLGAFWVGTSKSDFFLTAENPPRGAGRNRFLATISKTF